MLTDRVGERIVRGGKKGEYLKGWNVKTDEDKGWHGFLHRPCGETVWSFLIPWPSHSTPGHLLGGKGIYSSEDMYKNVQNSFIHDSQKLETSSWISVGEWSNRLWYIHTMEYYSAKKGMNYWYTPALGLISLSRKKNNPQRLNAVWCHLEITFEITKVWKLENRLVVARS